MRHSLYHCSHQLLAVILVVALFVGFCDARRLVAIGDLHGDYNQSLAVFRLTRLIDDRNHWIGEDAYLVQLGDILDVGPDDIRIVEFLMKMQRSAQKRGGDVVQLLGNHEIRNFRGDYRAVDPSSLSRSGGPKGRDYQLSNQTTIGRYLRTRKAIFHYGPFLFMHGGFSTATSNKLTSLRKVDQFNEELTRALMDGRISPLARHGLNLNEDDADDVENPILVRSLLNVKCKDLAAVLDKKFKGIQSVVVGHVPHDPQDFSDWRLCDGRLIDIDFGMSRWKKGDPGHVAALEIESSTWHVQLIEATMRFIDTADSLAEDGPESAAVPIRFLRLSVFLVGLVLAVVAVLALLCWSEWKKHRPALGTMGDCGTYGATA